MNGTFKIHLSFRRTLPKNRKIVNQEAPLFSCRGGWTKNTALRNRDRNVDDLDLRAGVAVI
jgi:hypothetical protein